MSYHEATGALITGGAQGLGLACAETLIDQGCKRLVITGRDAAKGAVAVERLRKAGADAHFLVCEMGDISAVQELVPRAADKIGDITALVNSAANTARGSILDTTPEVWDALMDPNAKGPFFLIQEFAKRAIARGHTGSVVNILSIVVHGGLPFLAPYIASKAALLGITKNAAAALVRHEIRINGINVGWMDTPGEDTRQRESHDRAEGWQSGAGQGLPFGRLVSPQEVARQVALFLSPDTLVTGTIMDFDQQVVGAYPDTDAV